MCRIGENGGQQVIRLVFIVVIFSILPGCVRAVDIPSIQLDAGKTGEPVSPFIYGQFIEHLGRCIYGGIWAEMLEDRKFYFSVTQEHKPYKMNPGDKQWDAPPFPELVASPWRWTGRGSVQMVQEKRFVGEHSPQITIAEGLAGIEQAGLGLVKGKKYTGYIWLAGDASSAPIRISLVWARSGEKQSRQSVDISRISGEYSRASFQFIAGESTEDGVLEIAGLGRGNFRVGAVSLMPADNVQGFRADVLLLLKQLNSPIYRWPGGNFVSGYNWRDGIGDRDRRPPRKNPAWTGVESNDVGLHEYLAFCRLLGAEPYIAANTGAGTPEQAGEEVQYCNGSAETPLGKLRAQNGEAAPFRVRYWSAGNEMYGKWQIGHMPLADYVRKHNLVAEAMTKADPNIKIIAVGSVGSWDETMLKECAGHMSLISEHFYCKSKTDLAAHVAQIPDNIRRIAEAHRRYRATIPGLQEKDIRIALDEWNFWYGPYIYGELGTQYFLKDALGIVAGIHEYARQSDMIFMANYAQTVNVIGALKTSKTAAVLDSTGVALALYRKEFGVIPVKVEGYTKPHDVMAAWSADRRALTVSVVNPTHQEYGFSLQPIGVSLASRGTVWVLTGPAESSCNIPGKEPQVTVKENRLDVGDGKLTVAPLSAALFRLVVK